MSRDERAPSLELIIDAQEALRLGLVDHVVPMSRLMSMCEEIAVEICKSAPLAVQAIKQAALRGLDLPLADGLKLERELFKSLQKTEDAREGARAFAEKRPPQWKRK
jgi:enoyl-CoA hydratase/carnithine racemase